MTGFEIPRVRPKALPFANETSGEGVYREIGARLIHRSEISTRHVSAEWLQRRGEGEAVWRLRQYRHGFFFFERGIHSFKGVSSDRSARQLLQGPTRLAFVAAGTPIEAIVEIPGRCSYTAAFLDADWLSGVDEDLARLEVHPSRIGFENPQVVIGMTQLRNELEGSHAMSRLLVESWTMQMWAHLHRWQVAPESREGLPLSRSDLKKVLGRMRERLNEDLSVSDLAGIARLGARQFCRRFRASTGTTPARAFEAMRLDRAAMLVSTTHLSITEIALECGFSQPQHLATAFRRRFGVTPSSYRADFK